MINQKTIKEARGKFIAMAVTYFLGVFNDNFFKQAVLLLGKALGPDYDVISHTSHIHIEYDPK